MERLRGGGLLVQGTPLMWEDSLPWLSYVREHGVLQFIHTYYAHKGRNGEKLLWGEELEYQILKVDRENKKVRISLRGAEVLETLRGREDKSGRSDNRKEACAWHPEYGAWMIEGTPRMPFGGFVRDLRRVELSMRLRRRRILAALSKDEIVPTITAFPMMGTQDFTDPPTEPNGPVAQSDTCSDAVINGHPRFATLTGNIRKRRGSKVNIKVPLFLDSKTEERCANETIPNPDEPLRMSGFDNWTCPRRHTIEMDCMAFGMGMCCLQVTFQARDIHESRHLYDQLAVLTPIMLALSASTPILKGRLADTDVRWATIAASVDDRTPQERGLEVCAPSHKGQMGWMAGGGARALPKSRYESISSYICDCKQGSDPTSSLDKYNDIPCPIDETSYETLIAAGIDKKLARHIAHLFVRDPLVIYSERIHIPDSDSTDHFENIQSTNWQTVRWKPPPPGSDVGWRVEFRSMEVQLTDFENAAFTVMTVLISRVLLYFRLNLYMPLSKVDKNMQEAHRRDAATEGKFWFRKHMAITEELEDGQTHDECELMSIYEILTGKGTHFPGLLPLVFAYLDNIGCDTLTRDSVRRYAMLLEKRAKGDLLTASAWIRKFVKQHPRYNNDSVVTDEIAYDLLTACSDIGEGRRKAPDLLGNVVIEPLTKDGAYEVSLESTPLDQKQRSLLIEKYRMRALDNKEKGTSISDGWTSPVEEQVMEATGRTPPECRLCVTSHACRCASTEGEKVKRSLSAGLDDESEEFSQAAREAVDS